MVTKKIKKNKKNVQTIPLTRFILPMIIKRNSQSFFILSDSIINYIKANCSNRILIGIYTDLYSDNAKEFNNSTLSEYATKYCIGHKKLKKYLNELVELQLLNLYKDNKANNKLKAGLITPTWLIEGKCSCENTECSNENTECSKEQIECSCENTECSHEHSKDIVSQSENNDRDVLNKDSSNKFINNNNNNKQKKIKKLTKKEKENVVVNDNSSKSFEDEEKLLDNYIKWYNKNHSHKPIYNPRGFKRYYYKHIDELDLSEYYAYLEKIERKKQLEKKRIEEKKRKEEEKKEEEKKRKEIKQYIEYIKLNEIEKYKELYEQAKKIVLQDFICGLARLSGNEREEKIKFYTEEIMIPVILKKNWNSN